jgi:hypothetical protein
MSTDIKALVISLFFFFLLLLVLLLTLFPSLTTKGDSQKTADAGCVLTYGGGETLTVSQAVWSTTSTNVTSIKKGETVTIPKSDTAYSFTAADSEIAKITNWSKVAKVVVEGGNAVADTSPFVVTVTLA